MLIELMVLYKLRMEGQYMYSMAKDKGLVPDLRHDGYTVRVCVAEVCTRRLISKFTYDALKQLGLKGTARKRAMRSLSEATQKASC